VTNTHHVEVADVRALATELVFSTNARVFDTTSFLFESGHPQCSEGWRNVVFELSSLEQSRLHRGESLMPHHGGSAAQASHSWSFFVTQTWTF
jgi:hypothetical protein